MLRTTTCLSDTDEIVAGFLALPLELRLIVYEHAFPVPHKSVRIWGNTWTDDDRKKGGATNLLLTCRQIFEEASPQVKKALAETTFLIDFELFSFNAGFHHPPLRAGHYEIMKGVLRDIKIFRDPRSGLTHTTIPAYMPLDKIRSLQLRLRGTPLEGGDGFTYNSLLMCALVATSRLHDCVNRCTKLEKFRVVVEEMGNRARWECVDHLVGAGARYMACHGEVEFVQIKRWALDGTWRRSGPGAE